MRKFWNWSDRHAKDALLTDPVSGVRNEDGERVLYLNGVIAEESWWADETTPKAFKNELESGSGDITVWLNSPGGDVFAAAQIYNMLKEYAGKVTVKIDGLAASAASVVAMSGDEVLMSPVSSLMIHNPATCAWGDSEEMRRAKEMLDEVKESILNAYELKTKMSRTKLAHLMDAETWMSARKAVELGFADKIMYTEYAADPQDADQGFVFSRLAVTNSLINKFQIIKPPVPTGTTIESLEKRLSLISR